MDQIRQAEDGKRLTPEQTRPFFCRSMILCDARRGWHRVSVVFFSTTRECVSANVAMSLPFERSPLDDSNAATGASLPLSNLKFHVMATRTSSFRPFHSIPSLVSARIRSRSRNGFVIPYFLSAAGGARHDRVSSEC